MSIIQTNFTIERNVLITDMVRKKRLVWLGLGFGFGVIINSRGKKINQSLN